MLMDVQGDRDMSERQFIEFQGVDDNVLRGETFGPDSGPVVLLLHGGGQTRHAWNATGRILAQRGWHAISVDQRGHGESDWVKNGHYAHEDFASDVIAISQQIRDRFGFKPIAVGASLGGMASLAAEGRKPGDTLAALVLVDITPRVDISGVERIRDFMVDKMEEGFATLDEAAEAIQNYLPNRKRKKNLDSLGKNLRLHDDGRYRWHWDPRFWEGSRTVATVRDDLARTLIAASKRLTIPTLLVRGRQSELVSEEHVEEFLTLVPHAKYRDISEAGHMVAGDQNDIFASAVIDFLRDLEDAPALAAG